jgi:ATP-dependent DNA ligase
MTTRTGIQLALPFEERRILNQGRFKAHWTPPYLIQPKLNGERCRMIVQDGRCFLLSSSESIIPTLPHINEQGLTLLDGEYDGELYVHGMQHNEIHSIVSRETTIHPDYSKMELHLFDLVIQAPQFQRLQELNIRLSSSLPNIKLVPTFVSKSLPELYEKYDNFISNGYEGFIVRHINSPYLRRRSPYMMKFKPKQTDEYLILDLEEAISENGTPKGILGAFVCQDDMKTIFKVGAGKLDHLQRRHIWQDYIETSYPVGLFLEVEYQTKSDKEKVPLFARAVKIL